MIWNLVHPDLHSFVGCVILRAGITQVDVLICRWLLGIWHQHVCIQQHSSKSCKAGLRTSTYQVHTKYILSTYWYILSTYLLHTQYRVMPAAFPDCDVAVTLQSQCRPATLSAKSALQGGMYSYRAVQLYKVAVVSYDT